MRSFLQNFFHSCAWRIWLIPKQTLIIFTKKILKEARNGLDSLGNKKVKSSMARSLPGSQWRIYYRRMWGQLSTTCSNYWSSPMATISTYYWYLPTGLETVFQEQSYSRLHSGWSLAWDHFHGNIDIQTCMTVALTWCQHEMTQCLFMKVFFARIIKKSAIGGS